MSVWKELPTHGGWWWSKSDYRIDDAIVEVDITAGSVFVRERGNRDFYEICAHHGYEYAPVPPPPDDNEQLP